MNKKLVEYFKKYDFTFSKNYAYGKIKDYEVNVFYQALDNVAPVKIYVSFYASENEKNQMISDLNEQKIKFLQYSFDGIGALFGLNDITLNGLLKKLDNIIETIFDIIIKNNGKNSLYCPMCGEEFDDESKVYKVNDCNFKLHKKCGSEIAEAFEEEYKEYKELPNNYGKGFLGALIGAVVGVVSYVIIFFVGFISSISSFISILLGSFLYKKFGGKPNYMMIIMTSVLTVASLILTVYLLYNVAALGLVITEDPNTQMTAGEAFKYMMQNADFAAEYRSNMGMTILFTLIGAGYETYALYKGVFKKRQVK